MRAKADGRRSRQIETAATGGRRRVRQIEAQAQRRRLRYIAERNGELARCIEAIGRDASDSPSAGGPSTVEPWAEMRAAWPSTNSPSANSRMVKDPTTILTGSSGKHGRVGSGGRRGSSATGRRATVRRSISSVSICRRGEQSRPAPDQLGAVDRQPHAVPVGDPDVADHRVGRQRAFDLPDADAVLRRRQAPRTGCCRACSGRSARGPAEPARYRTRPPGASRLRG